MEFTVFDAANPRPNNGCMMKNGAETVIIPKMSAGIRVGCQSQSMPATARKITANRMPVI